MSLSTPGSEPPGPGGGDGSEPLAWRFWRALQRGLIVLGAFNGLADEELTALVVAPGSGLAGPAPGHPEKLLPWDLSPEERELWARLNYPW